MKIQIRRNVFETNSSSVHTISIVNDSSVKKYPKEIIFADGEFGWSNDTYTLVDSKASYIWECLEYYSNSNDPQQEIKDVQNCIDKITNILAKYNITSIFPYNNPVIEKSNFNGKDYFFVNWLDNNGKKSDGYLDHGNECHDFIDDILNNEKLLLNFLFDTNSYIITGNDNEDEYPDEPSTVDINNRYIYEKGN